MSTLIEWALNHMEPAPFPHSMGNTVSRDPLRELEHLYETNESVRALCDQYSRDYGTLGVSHGLIARVCDQLGIPK